jgi:hypothetical protein
MNLQYAHFRFETKKWQALRNQFSKKLRIHANQEANFYEVDARRGRDRKTE